MAHKEQQNYISSIKEKFPTNFKNCKVLDIGSFDVCGTESSWFENSDFIGLDIGPGPGVDVVCPAQDYDAPDNTFDTIISCECWEHNPYYEESIQNAVRMLKPGGLFVFTCATTGRAVHGTKSLEEVSKEKYENWKTMPNVLRENWDNDYYRNLTEEDIRKCLNFEDTFESFEFSVEPNHFDLYFWGIKK
jgi:SAM-dependent methyltransferase